MDTANSSSSVAGVRINSDAAIRTLGDDRLDRREFAETIAGRIQLAGEGASVVFGLIGPWGSGKTSALSMITDAIRSSGSSTWSVVEFTPWAAESGHGLLEEFYQVIASAMPATEKGLRAKKAVMSAAPVALAMVRAAGVALVEKHLGDEALKDIGKAGADALADRLGEIPTRAAPDPFTTQFTTISKAINDAGMNILVVVDDIDRLHANELLSVMKAVRLLGRFDRVHYMLSYDEETVLGVLKGTDIANHDARRAQKYLEKIVQYPFALPPIQQVHLAREFRTQLGAVSAAHGGPEIETTSPDVATISSFDPWGAPANGGEDDLADLLLAALPTDRMNLRSIYRLCNQLDILLTLAGGASELDLYDATLITYIRLHYPTLYNQIPRWRKDLLSNASSWISGKQPTVEEKQSQVAKFIETESAVDHEIAYGILARLFPDTLPKPKWSYIPERPKILRISSSNYFDRYFAFGIPVRDIRDADVREDFAHLTRTGEWQPDSIIRDRLSDPEFRKLVRVKIMGNLDVLANATPVSAARAAHLLTQALPSGDVHFQRRVLLFDGWGTVLYLLLGHAVCSSDASAASGVVDDYAASFGIPPTADLLSSAKGIDGIAGIDASTITMASKNVRDQVKDRCMLDLTTELTPDQLRTHSVLSFLHYLDDDLWAKLSQHARDLLANGTVTLAGLGARFVSASKRFDSWHLEFHNSDFTKLIPEHLWDTSTLPPSPDGEQHEPGTLAHRTSVAANSIRALVGQPTT
ncbi:KAP family P-loop NTPase fold protein [Rhodococcoides kroppenstedtii]|uniref:KAP family P-loop NTPase fold protein n=1 Tax=Rhodococcoides kroppenstedtii TaxID=293050 RepID=UPI0028E6FD4A|nr:P-loop NTPase fold protein [Rhodococcus kroppenstedtii]